MYRFIESKRKKMPRIEFIGDAADDDAATASAESERRLAPLPKRKRPAKRKRDDEDESVFSGETKITKSAGEARLSLETIRQQNEGIFGEMKCLVCEKMLGADLQIDDSNLMQWNETYYTLRDYASPKEMYDYLAKQYNATLATDGDELTALQVRNHFEQNHMLDSQWSIRNSIRNLETVEQRLSQHCFTADSFDPKAIDALLKVTTTKHTLYNTRRKTTG